ncbi:MAG: electron transfer flavoprotein subunit alpha/FixB family protein [Bacteroidetes bacterium]|nr:MAG: electron transfer flavoprotein subunit alpha/FixB family protein [Bacteroidota bacterium]RLD86807.1 MAG: electron transfer flavoprotein subunit alpha/FixB family protein [Bacteroidota bacterium]
MSILVYTENWDGKFKKLSFELISYAKAIADKLNLPVTALSIGNVADDELKQLGNYGASKILNVADERFDSLDNKALAEAVAHAAKAEDAQIIVFSHNNVGKAIAPRVTVKLNGGLVSGVTALPESFDPFIVKKKVFTQKAFAHVQIDADIKILTLAQNSFELIETENNAAIESYDPQVADDVFSTTVKETNKVTGKVLLTDAEIVISGGRGMKGPENWGQLEELADVLGAGLACSRPVSDEGWRGHEEHVGQTGKIIAPNLYFAFGISGAIQHLGGVSSSKFIVAVNKDPEAPIFEAADYGIVGDLFKVLPQLIEEVKIIKG